MPPFLTASKAVRSFVSGRNGVRQLIGASKSNGKFQRWDQLRGLSSSIVGIENPYDHKPIGAYRDHDFAQTCMNSRFVQTRKFLGVGDGEEGSVLSKVYEERLIMGYSPEQLFNVVAAVDLYHGFVPWCQRSDIIKHNPDGSFDAELEIGFKFLVESYISHVEMQRPKYIKTTSSQSSLFDHLINVWEFNPGPSPGTCNLYFLVDFKFQSPLYRQVASMFFKEVVSRMIGSFSDRCRLIYGPGKPVPDNSSPRT